MTANNTVLAVFVTYNPDLEILHKSVQTLSEASIDCLIVDNASQNNIHFPDHDQQVITLDENAGLGVAQNVGINHAKQAGYDYVLLMDQDSLPDRFMVSELLKAHEEVSLVKNVAAVGPCYENATTGSRSEFVRFGWLRFQRVSSNQADDLGCVDCDFLISSGSLFKLSVFDQIGLMDESLFIDHVDTEWFLRAKAAGYQAVGSYNAKMQHALGNQTHEINWTARKRQVPQHAPFRYYYIFRNSILLYKRRGFSFQWKINDLVRLSVIFLMFALVHAPRRQNFSMMIRGIFDGLRGRAGKLKTGATV